MLHDQGYEIIVCKAWEKIKKDIFWIRFLFMMKSIEGERILFGERLGSSLKGRILLVEDDEMIREVVSDYLQGREQSYEVECASTGKEGLKLMQEKSFDLILLDVMLPGMSGFSLLRELRKQKDTPVIMITARVREEDRLKGYELGCDDYVCKPFLMSELYAKVGAVLRRTKGNGSDKDREKPVLSCGLIRADLAAGEVFVKGEKIDLTPKEYDLLIMLMRRPDQIFTREVLLELVWGMDYDGTDRTVDNHVKKLRKSLGAAHSQIRTIYGKGYKLTGK